MTVTADKGNWRDIGEALPFLDLNRVEKEVIIFILFHGRRMRWVVNENFPAAVSLNTQLTIPVKTLYRALTSLRQRGWLIEATDSNNKTVLILTEQLVTDSLAVVEHWRVRRAIGTRLWSELIVAMETRSVIEMTKAVLAEAETMPDPPQRERERIRMATIRVIRRSEGLDPDIAVPLFDKHPAS